MSCETRISIVPAQYGTKAIRQSKDGDVFVGETIIAFSVGYLQWDNNVEPSDSYVEPFSFAGPDAKHHDSSALIAILFQDGTVDFFAGGSFDSLDSFIAWINQSEYAISP